MALNHLLDVFIVVSSAFIFTSSIDQHTFDNAFKNYIIKFDKAYHPGSDEYVYRKSVFLNNLKRYEWLNKKRQDNSSAYYGINKFSDFTPEEFKEQYLSMWKPSIVSKQYQPPSNVLKFISKNGPQLLKSKLPDKVDWRGKGVISEVKNQGSCGACWAYSTVETIETMHALKNGSLTQLSVQQVIDCARIGNFGCLGGDTCTTLFWLQKDDVPIHTEAQYPVTNIADSCKVFPSTAKGVHVKDFTCLNYKGNEDEMLRRLAEHGPLTVSVDAQTWNDYIGGVIQYHCPNFINHAVQIVGYDKTGPVPFYIVRNSWGKDFGHDGYMYIKMGDNLCGIAEHVSSIEV